jgi:hypothetical protein
MEWAGFLHSARFEKDSQHLCLAPFVEPITASLTGRGVFGPSDLPR